MLVLTQTSKEASASQHLEGWQLPRVREVTSAWRGCALCVPACKARRHSPDPSAEVRLVRARRTVRVAGAGLLGQACTIPGGPAHTHSAPPQVERALYACACAVLRRAACQQLAMRRERG
eukprot:scaffold4251_cov430-Prasinococcus_capsulatus_cf.AAC.4